MTKLPGVLAGLCATLVASAAACDELLPASSAAHEDHAASPYPPRWCLEHFVAATRASRPTRARLAFPSPEPAYNDRLPVMAAAYDSTSRWNGTLIARLAEDRSLRLATVWSGRKSAVYFGIDDHGILGFSLAERNHGDGR